MSKPLYQVGDEVVVCSNGHAFLCHTLRVFTGDHVETKLEEIRNSYDELNGNEELKASAEILIEEVLGRDIDAFKNHFYAVLPVTYPGVASYEEACVIVGKSLTQLQYGLLTGKVQRIFLHAESDLIDAATYRETSLLSKDNSTDKPSDS